MRILHIGWGFKPWRVGGAIDYSQDIMSAQQKAGHEVFYFCSGRHYPFSKTTKLKKWQMDKIRVYEIINSPIFHSGDAGTAYPLLDIEEPESLRIFNEVLKEVIPEIIHIQELAGLPTTLIDMIKESRVPSVMTLHDYFLLCPTLKLFDYRDELCVETKIGHKCKICCNNAPRTNKESVNRTMINAIRRLKLIFSLLKRIKTFFNKITTRKHRSKRIFNNAVKRDEVLEVNYQKRRDINLEKLKKIDLLLSQSKRVADIYGGFLLKRDNIKVLHSSVSHISKIRFKDIKETKDQLNFATFNGCATVPKGSRLMLETLKILTGKGLSNSFKMHIYGGIDSNFKRYMSEMDNVIYHGFYKQHEIDEILKNIDVGIVPSVWEEVYGYVGIEFLSKGVPVIGNKIGGITDYTVEEVTGLLNKSLSAKELADIMESLINDPSKICELNSRIKANINKYITTLDDHVKDLEKIYSSLMKKG